MERKPKSLAKVLAGGPKSNKIKRQEKKLKDERARIAESLRMTELAKQQAREAQIAALRASRANVRRPEDTIRDALQGKKVQVDLNSDLYPIIQICHTFANARSEFNIRGESLLRLLLTVREKSSFLTGYQPNRFANGLLALASFESDWVRPIKDWKPNSHNAYRQFYSLARHLMAVYDVPWFMDHAWFGGMTLQARKEQEWFRHIGIGKNIRTADNLPIPLTKKMAHYFLQAPGDFDIMGAFRWGQMTDLGADERMIRAIIPTRIGSNFQNDEFWVSVIRWLIEQPMLDTAHYGPILDWIHQQRFVPTIPNPRHATDWREPRNIPAQPHLSMKGRHPDALLRSVDAWHKQLGKEKGKRGDLVWSPCGIAPFELEEGKDRTFKRYTITEILNSKDLREEGRLMSHCVSSYDHSCSNGSVSIWSMKLQDETYNETRLVTIEVRNRNIVQVRQKYNKMPTVKELFVLNRWAASANLSISNWIKPQ